MEWSVEVEVPLRFPRPLYECSRSSGFPEVRWTPPVLSLSESVLFVLVEIGVENEVENEAGSEVAIEVAIECEVEVVAILPPEEELPPRLVFRSLVRRWTQ